MVPKRNALTTSSEGSPHIAIYQQVDHHDDGNNPTAHNSEDGMGLHVPKVVQHDIDNLYDQGEDKVAYMMPDSIYDEMESGDLPVINRFLKALGSAQQLEDE